MRPSTHWLLGLVLVVGCTTTTSRLRTRFSKEHGCPESETRVVESGGTAYVATGCGQSAEYVCQTFASANDDPRACEERGLPKKTEPPPMAGPKPPPDPPGPTPK